MVRPDEDRALEEFDRWADAGRGESMARGHRGVTEPVIARWNLDATSIVLDVGCGNGWAVRWMIDQGAGRGLGVDISPKMIHRAQTATLGDKRFEFQTASAQALPFEDASVSHLLNVESLYYYPDPAAALAEWARVVRPGGHLAIIVDLYAENPATHAWVDALDVDVHLLGADQCVQMTTDGGWRDVRWFQMADPRPVLAEDDFEASVYWPSYAMYLDYRKTGALVIEATR